jgi:hypothetical protein
LNRKGIFCFILLLAIIGIELRLLGSAAHADEKLGFAKTAAIEAERLNTVRAVLESNVDGIVEETMREQLLLNRRPEEIKQAVNSRLLGLFSATESAYAPRVSIGFRSANGALDQKFLNENSAVLVAQSHGKELYCEYCFTGGAMKNNEITGEISGENALVIFKIPPGYTIGAIVAK